MARKLVMSKKRLTIPHDAIVLVANGQKALLLHNKGDEKFLSLSAERVLVDDNPMTHQQGADRAGRAFKRAATHSRSAMETTDWHEIEKHRFAREIAAIMKEVSGARSTEAVILVAPPRVLVDLRYGLRRDTRHRVIAEIAKDLTKHSIEEIERYLGSTVDASL
jgi:protein required for attachment to host cells